MRFQTLLMPAVVVAISGMSAMGVMSKPHSDPIDATVDVKPIVKVIDGDTLEVNGETVRLAYIDAPELGQSCDQGGHLVTCGREAAYSLRKLIGLANTIPTCEVIAGSGTSMCWLGSTDLAEVMLASGAVMALEDAPIHYKAVEKRARSVPIGIWKGEFVSPAMWRTGERLQAENEAAQGAKMETELPWRVAGVQILPEPISHGDPCLIKAVESPSAGRQYFSPLDPGYDAYDVADAKTRTFCSDDEARSAGWRHAR